MIRRYILFKSSNLPKTFWSYIGLEYSKYIAYKRAIIIYPTTTWILGWCYAKTVSIATKNLIAIYINGCKSWGYFLIKLSSTSLSGIGPCIYFTIFIRATSSSFSTKSLVSSFCSSCIKEKSFFIIISISISLMPPS